MFLLNVLRQTKSIVVFMVISTIGLPASANETSTLQYGTYGSAGLVDMPTAVSPTDAELATTYTNFAGISRTTLSFQITPRLSGSFRYSGIANNLDGRGLLWDRSFDVAYRLIDETDLRPAVSIGLRDIIGTGVYSSEYVVATKHFGPSVSATVGLGWGRLGSYGGFDNPLAVIDPRFEERPGGFSGLGGELETLRWFRGDVAAFGGLTWQANDRLRLAVEYSSDNYDRERNPGFNRFDRASPFNLGASYAITPNLALQAYYLYGAEFGLGITTTLNPRQPVVNGGLGQRPTPVERRSPGAAANQNWTQQGDAQDILRDNMRRLLAFEGMTLVGSEITPTSVTVLIENDTYSAGSEAIGRTSRILTKLMPASVEDFAIILTENNLRLSRVDLRRSDIEDLEFASDNADLILQRARLSDAQALPQDVTWDRAEGSGFTWGIGPYVGLSFFDPDQPLRGEIGAELTARYEPVPGLFFNGTVRQPILSNIDEGRVSPSAIQRVRTDGVLYAAAGSPAITELTATYRTNITNDIYGRITAGYLESMYGGLSVEALWKPVDSRLGIGAELNYVKQRDFDQLFGFREYDVVTGHVSAYYAINDDWHAQVDVGRYLAGDIGATFALDREFDNGWRVGAYATLTDVPFEDFGEGSFDKGLRFTIPVSHFFGSPTREVRQATIQSITRDGGARLKVRGRLYETVRDYHRHDLEGSWGRFWR